MLPHYGSPYWVSEAKTIKYCFCKRWSPKRELTEPSKRRRQATTREGEWREAEPATLFRSAQRRVCFANVAQRNKLRNHDVLSVRVKQKKEKQKQTANAICFCLGCPNNFEPFINYGFSLSFLTMFYTARLPALQ